MNFDFLAYPLGKFLKFIYDIAFENYGLAIIIFTFIVSLQYPPDGETRTRPCEDADIPPLIDTSAKIQG